MEAGEARGERPRGLRAARLHAGRGQRCEGSIRARSPRSPQKAPSGEPPAHVPAPDKRRRLCWAESVTTSTRPSVSRRTTVSPGVYPPQARGPSPAFLPHHTHVTSTEHGPGSPDPGREHSGISAWGLQGRQAATLRADRDAPSGL